MTDDSIIHWSHYTSGLLLKADKVVRGWIQIIDGRFILHSVNFIFQCIFSGVLCNFCYILSLVLHSLTGVIFWNFCSILWVSVGCSVSFLHFTVSLPVVSWSPNDCVHSHFLVNFQHWLPSQLRHFHRTILPFSLFTRLLILPFSSFYYYSRENQHLH